MLKQETDIKPSNLILERIGPEGKEIEGILYKNAKIIMFEGQKYVVSNHTELSINVSGNCNASCSFCTNNTTFMPNNNWIDWNENSELTREFASAAEVEKISFT